MNADARARHDAFATSEATVADAIAEEIAGDIGRADPMWRRVLTHRDTAIVLVALALFIFFALAAHRFLAAYTMMELARRASILGILAVGMTYLFVAGELDLSIGSHYGFLLILMSYQNEHLGIDPTFAALIVLVIGLLIGALNGVLVTRVGLPSFITTLGMLALLRGATAVISSGYPIPAKNTALAFYQVIRGNLPGTKVPNMFVAMLVVVLIGGIILARTRFGYHVYASGGNAAAARNAGINVARVKFRCFVAMGGLCALAAIILFGRVGLAPLNAGYGLELQVITAIIIGGVGLYGGRGSMIGSTVGVLILCMITSGLILLGVEAYWDGVATGAMIIIAVGLNLALHRRQVRGGVNG